jgi:succinate dehydrogenase / fumarate reductase iron-sulfur subunit
MERVVYRIRRFDGEKAFWQEYSFGREPNKTVLWGLQRIKETIDPSLAFVAACRSAVCGACAVRVNGEAVLACETPLDALTGRFGNTLVLEPLGNFPVIRDLAVDWEPKAARLAEAKPWLMPKDEFTAAAGCRQSQAEFRKINAQTNCILCGACASECNKLSAGDDDFYEPFVYTKAGKFVADTRDGSPGEHLRPVLARGLWKCVHCQECVTKCPKKVAPAEDIAALRRASLKLGLGDNQGARHARAFADDIAATGRLNEVTMAIKTDGLLKSATRLPYALRLLRRGKLNPLHFPAPVEGIEGVRRIVKAAKEANE